jgi:hydroxymethylglutaryl-CoA lyase
MALILFSNHLPSEDVLYLRDGLGIRTGVDLAALAQAGRAISQALGREPASKAALALAAKALAS